MMRSFILTGGCLAVLLFLSQCWHRTDRDDLYTRADSLLGLTLGLQSRLGSPEIQRMHDFQVEIDSDFAFLDTFSLRPPSLARYRELYNGLGHCMQACSQYHEEAFILESSLREIMEKASLRKADRAALEERLEFESENYRDLSARIDSSLNLAIRQAETYYSLKPEINGLRDQYRSP
jgi:hypothetical protein